MSTQQRLHAVAAKRLETGEAVQHWTRAWVARQAPSARLQPFSARWRDYLVLTDRRLMLFSARHLSRRPHQRVLAERLDTIAATVEPRRRGSRIRLGASDHRRPGSERTVLVLDIGNDSAALAIVAHLATLPGPAPAPAPEDLPVV